MKKTIEQVVTETLRNVMNYPENVAPHVLGTNMSQTIDAVVTALKAEGYEDPVDPCPIPLGTRVRVTANLPFYKGLRGVVVDNPHFSETWPIRVEFKDGRSEIFRLDEVEVISE